MHTAAMRYLAIAAMLLSPVTGHAADDAFPLGLENLHWDMPQAEVNGRFRLQAEPFHSPTSPLQPGETRLKSEAYTWQTCHFEGVWRFFKSGLHAVNLVDAEGSRACIQSIMGALRARYGEATVTTVRGADNYEWKTTTTKVKFLPSVGFGSFVWFYRPEDEAAAAKP